MKLQRVSKPGFWQGRKWILLEDATSEQLRKELRRWKRERLKAPIDDGREPSLWAICAKKVSQLEAELGSRKEV
jgi:hypothetical protein